MKLHENMVNSGQFIFRWRSYFPLLFLAPAIAAFHDMVVIVHKIGEPEHHVWSLVCFLIALSGLAIRWATVGFVPAGTSGRNTKGQRAEVLNTSGIYSIVRNPLYLGNYITILGIMLSTMVWWMVVIFSLGFFLYMERIIMTEEAFLSEKFGQPYAEWCAKTPIIIPDFRLWRRPEMEFSVKSALRREYPGLFNLALAFLMIEFITDILIAHQPFIEWLHEDGTWILGFVAAAIVCGTLRCLKKYTSVLAVAGR